MALSRKRKAAAEEHPAPDHRSMKAVKLKESSPDIADDVVCKTAVRLESKSGVSMPQRKRKRKSAAMDDTDDEGPRVKPTPRRHAKELEKYTAFITPQHKRFKDALPPSPAETPSRKTALLFDRLRLDGPKPPSCTLSKVNDTPPDTPESLRHEDEGDLPEELRDILALHAAFLAAVTLQHAYNESSSRIDLSDLLPTISHIWKKRAVQLDDVRRVLFLAQKSGSGLVLEDFGRAGLSIELNLGGQKRHGRANTGSDTARVNAESEAHLCRRWSRWLCINDNDDQVVQQFIANLPLADIVQNSSVNGAAPLLSRGQQRLTDLRSHQAAAQTESSSVSTAVKTEDKKPAAIQKRGTSLLDRVLAKQSLTASMPAGATKDQLERKAALHRIEDVARVLELLSTGRPRASFSVQSVVQHLKQSLRSPISPGEAHRCLELMSEDIMPTFVKLIRSGNVTGVVVTKGGKLGLPELKRRLASAGA